MTNEVQRLKLHRYGEPETQLLKADVHMAFFRLGFLGEYTDYSYNIEPTHGLPSAAEWQTALEGLSTIGTGNIAVTDETDGWTFTFQGALADTNVSTLVVEHVAETQKTANTIVVEIVTPGEDSTPVDHYAWVNVQAAVAATHEVQQLDFGGAYWGGSFTLYDPETDTTSPTADPTVLTDVTAVNNWLADWALAGGPELTATGSNGIYQIEWPSGGDRSLLTVPSDDTTTYSDQEEWVLDLNGNDTGSIDLEVRFNGVVMGTGTTTSLDQTGIEDAVADALAAAGGWAGAWSVVDNLDGTFQLVQDDPAFFGNISAEWTLIDNASGGGSAPTINYWAAGIGVGGESRHVMRIQLGGATGGTFELDGEEVATLDAAGVQAALDALDPSAWHVFPEVNDYIDCLYLTPGVITEPTITDDSTTGGTGVLIDTSPRPGVDAATGVTVEDYIDGTAGTPQIDSFRIYDALDNEVAATWGSMTFDGQALSFFGWAYDLTPSNPLASFGGKLNELYPNSVVVTWGDDQIHDPEVELDTTSITGLHYGGTRPILHFSLPDSPTHGRFTVTDPNAQESGEIYAGDGSGGYGDSNVEVQAKLASALTSPQWEDGALFSYFEIGGPFPGDVAVAALKPSDEFNGTWTATESEGYPLIQTGWTGSITTTQQGAPPPAATDDYLDTLIIRL